MLRLFSSSVLLFISLFSNLNAQTFTLSLEGQVAEISATDLLGVDDTAAFSAILPFAEGDSVSAAFSWDAADANSTSSFRSFDSQGISVGIGDVDFVGDAFRLQLGQNGSSNVIFAFLPFEVSSFLPQGWDIQTTGNSGSFTRGISLRDSTGTALDGSNLPASGLSISDFDSPTFQLSDTSSSSWTWTTPLGTHTGDEHIVRVDFTSLSISGAAVPEPSAALVLLALGVVGSTVRRRGQPCL